MSYISFKRKQEIPPEFHPCYCGAMRKERFREKKPGTGLKVVDGRLVEDVLCTRRSSSSSKGLQRGGRREEVESSILSFLIKEVLFMITSTMRLAG